MNLNIIVIVEDNPIQLKDITELISSNFPKLLVHSFMDPVDSFSFIAKELPGIIILDNRLPTMDGENFVKLIYGLNKNLNPHHTMGLAYAPYTMLISGDFVYNGNIFGYVDTKPFDREALIEAIRRALNGDYVKRPAFFSNIDMFIDVTEKEEEFLIELMTLMYVRKIKVMNNLYLEYLEEYPNKFLNKTSIRNKIKEIRNKNKGSGPKGIENSKDTKEFLTNLMNFTEDRWHKNEEDDRTTPKRRHRWFNL